MDLTLGQAAQPSKICSSTRRTTIARRGLPCTLCAHDGHSLWPNDSPRHLAAGVGPVRVDHGERDVLRHTDGDDPALAVVAAGVLAFQDGTLEGQRRKFEVKSTISQIPSALSSVPDEAHQSTIQLYIQHCKRHYRSARAAESTTRAVPFLSARDDARCVLLLCRIRPSVSGCRSRCERTRDGHCWSS